jgi:hypothetical protein
MIHASTEIDLVHAHFCILPMFRCVLVRVWTFMCSDCSESRFIGVLLLLVHRLLVHR